MRMLASDRLKLLIKLAAVCSWVVLVVLSLLPGSDRPHTGLSGNAEHVIAYLLSALVTRFGFDVESRLQFVCFSTASAFFEICQIYIPGRHSGFDNWAWSSAGAAIGILLGRIIAHARDRSARTSAF